MNDEKTEESKTTKSPLIQKKPLLGKRTVGASAVGGGANKFAMKGSSMTNKLGGLGAKKDTKEKEDNES